MTTTITKLEAAAANVKDAEQKVEAQAGVIRQYADRLAELRKEYAEAENRMNAGQGSADDVDTVALGPGRIEAMTNGLHQAKELHGQLGTRVNQAKVLEFVERVREDHPDGITDEIQAIKDEVAAQFAKMLIEAGEKITELRREDRKIADEFDTLAKPLIWEHGDVRHGFYVDETPASREVGITLGSRRIGTSPSLRTEDGYSISAQAGVPFRELEGLGEELGKRASMINSQN